MTVSEVAEMTEKDVRLVRTWCRNAYSRGVPGVRRRDKKSWDIDPFYLDEVRDPRIYVDKQVKLDRDLDYASRSIGLLYMFEPSVVAFSGGKDSVVLKELALESGIDCRFIYNKTGIDPPELVRFIREYHPDVEIVRPPKRNWWDGVKANGLPLRNQRWCCQELKEHGGEGGRLAVGVRAEESVRRSKYGIAKFCPRVNTEIISPILHWTEDQVWEFIRDRELPYCSLYDEGWRRLGCVPCPFEGAEMTKVSMEKWPKIFEATRKCAEEYYERLKLEGRGPWTVFKTFEGWWQWWLSRDQPFQEDTSVMGND